MKTGQARLWAIHMLTNWNVGAASICAKKYGTPRTGNSRACGHSRGSVITFCFENLREIGISIAAASSIDWAHEKTFHCIFSESIP